MKVLVLHYTGDFEGLDVATFATGDEATDRFTADRASDRYGWLVENTNSLISRPPLAVPEDEASPVAKLTGAHLAKVWNAFCSPEFRVTGRFTNRTAAAMRVARMLLAKFGDEDEDTAAIRDASAEVATETAEVNADQYRQDREEESPACGVADTATAELQASEPASVDAVPPPVLIGPPSNTVEPPIPTARAPRGFSFAAKGVPVGAELVSKFDAALKATVLGEGGRISYGGVQTSLSKAALDIARASGRNWPTIQGTAFWLYDGKRLVDL